MIISCSVIGIYDYYDNILIKLGYTNSKLEPFSIQIIIITHKHTIHKQNKKK